MAAWTSNEFRSYKSQNSYNLLGNICLFTHSAIIEKYVNSNCFLFILYFLVSTEFRSIGESSLLPDVH